MHSFGYRGMEDHIHIETSFSRTISMADLVKKVKCASSSWLKSLSKETASFSWQRGYSVFSVSCSNRYKVEQYIRNQELHHTKVSFYDELITMYEKADLLFDERYLFLQARCKLVLSVAPSELWPYVILHRFPRVHSLRSFTLG